MNEYGFNDEIPQIVKDAKNRKIVNLTNLEYYYLEKHDKNTFYVITDDDEFDEDSIVEYYRIGSENNIHPQDFVSIEDFRKNIEIKFPEYFV